MDRSRHPELATTRRAYGYLRARPHFATLVILTIASLLVLLPVWHELTARDITGSFSFTDFWVYYSTTGDWFAGEAIYNVEDPFGHYLYPPVYLIGIIPFYEIQSWPLAAEVGAATSLLALWFALQALVWTYVPSLTTLERLLLAPISLVLLVGFHPLLYGMRLGQMSVMIAAIVTASVVAMEHSNPNRPWMARLSGALTTIGGTIKVFYAPVGAHLLVDRRRLVGAVLAGATLVGLSVAIFGISVHQDYLQVLAWGEDWGAEPNHPSWGWIPGYYRPLYFIGQSALPVPVFGHELPLSLLVRLALIGGIIALGVWLYGRNADREVFAVGILAIPLVGPQVSVHDFSILLPAILMMLAVEVRRGSYPWIPVAALLLFHWQAYGTYLFANAPEWVPFSTSIIHYSPWLQPALYANIALLGLAAYRALEYRPPKWFDRLASAWRKIVTNKTETGGL